MWDQSRNDVPPWVMPHNPAWDIIAQPGSNVPGFGRETLRPSERVHMMHVLPLPSYFFHIKSAEKLKSYFLYGRPFGGSLWHATLRADFRRSMLLSQRSRGVTF